MVRQKEKKLAHHIDDMGSPQLSNPSSNKHNGGIFIHTQIFGKLSNESWVMNQSKQANGCIGFSLHCKDIQSNLYSFQMCPNFHCNLTVWFTFNCCSKYSWIIVKLIYSFYCNFYIGLYEAIKCKPYSEITVESWTQLKTVHICSVRSAEHAECCVSF